jgi:pentatricopeptide repeat protein
MALSLLSPPLSPLSPLFKNSSTIATPRCTLFSSFYPFTFSPPPILRAYCTSKDGVTSEQPSISLDNELLRRLSGAKDADQVLDGISETGNDGVVKMDTSDCNSLMGAAFERGNSELALSLFDAMRLGFSPGFNFGVLAKHLEQIIG